MENRWFRLRWWYGLVYFRIKEEEGDNEQCMISTKIARVSLTSIFSLPRKLLMTHLRRLKNTCIRLKCPSAVNCRTIQNRLQLTIELSSAVNYRCDPATNLEEALSSIITLFYQKKFKSLKNLSKKPNQIQQNLSNKITSK